MCHHKNPQARSSHPMTLWFTLPPIDPLSSVTPTYLATSLPPSLLTIGDHLLHTSLSFSSTLICLVHCVWPSYSSVLSTLWCCQTIVSSVCLFSFFLQPCLLQSVEWVGCHCLSLCDQSKPVLESLSFPAIPFWHQVHWECHSKTPNVCHPKTPNFWLCHPKTHHSNYIVTPKPIILIILPKLWLGHVTLARILRDL